MDSRNTRSPGQQTILSTVQLGDTELNSKVLSGGSRTAEYRAHRAINSDKRIPSGRRALNVRERIVCERQ